MKKNTKAVLKFVCGSIIMILLLTVIYSVVMFPYLYRVMEG